MRTFLAGGAAIAVAAQLLAQSVPPVAAPEMLPYWPPGGRPSYAALEARLLSIPDVSKLRAWHDLLGSEPHVAPRWSGGR